MTVRVDRYLAHPPERVWRALTDTDPDDPLQRRTYAAFDEGRRSHLMGRLEEVPVTG
ncbi:hypothetical protein [Streptosporangium sp. NPDC002607]